MVLDNPELTQQFVETTLETLDGLNQALLKLEQSPGDVDLINSVFRFAHNLKGATGAAGCQTLYRLTHDMESVLDLVRGRTLRLCEEMMTTIFAATDRIRADIKLVREGRAGELIGEGTVGLFTQWIGSAVKDLVPSSRDTSEASAPAPDRASTRSSSLGSGEDHEDTSRLVSVTFPKGHPEAPIQAYLIFNKLREIGEVVKTVPDVDALDAAAEITEIQYHVQSNAPAEEIRKVVSLYAVESVAVSGGAFSEARPETLSGDGGAPTQNAGGAMAPKDSPANPPAPKPSASGPPGGRPSPATTAPSAKKPAAAKAGKDAPKLGETIRVDLERLDQLMNLGGELVINKARLVQIQSRLGSLFQEQNLGYLVNDISERLARLQQGIGKLGASATDARLAAELSDTTLSLTHDFSIVSGLLQRFHECRPAMTDFGEALHSLNRVSEGIQKRVMETRMVAIGPLFERFRRVIRDISKATGKNVELVLHGEATELDKRMIDELGDPLTHIIRNSVDHGIEQPEDRIKAGKPPAAKITLNAYHRGRHICIEVKDDGRGVNLEAVRNKILERQLATPDEVERMSEKEIVQYIFKPGFSTAEKVTDLSGRGMGMDIVMTKLDAINGAVDVQSVTGVGCTVTIKLPLTLAIITAIIARIGRGVYAVPLEAVAEIITVPQSGIQYIQRRRVIRVRDRVIPVALFEQIFQCGAAELRTRCKNDPNLTLVIFGIQNERIGLVVDELIGQEDVVIKSVADNYRNISGVTGASIMGDGSVSLILDVASMMTMLASRSEADLTAALAEGAPLQTLAGTAPAEVLDAAA
jgi:two-component system chemotaxis sensor kinase CheA